MPTPQPKWKWKWKWKSRASPWAPRARLPAARGGRVIGLLHRRRAQRRLRRVLGGGAVTLFHHALRIEPAAAGQALEIRVGALEGVRRQGGGGQGCAQERAG